MDAGAIGSIAAGYPLQLWEADDPRLLATVDYLMDHCRYEGGFFQDMIHSGINAYLTLHLAQVLLRAGDGRYWELIQTVAELASPTGQWPEAVHPQTGGGCMGDGQHIWAAAEWVLIIRAMFVREEQDRLVLGAGLPATWVNGREPISFGPTPTAWGDITVTIKTDEDATVVSWQGAWRGKPPTIDLRLPGYETVTAERDQQSVRLARRAVEAVDPRAEQ